MKTSPSQDAVPKVASAACGAPCQQCLGSCAKVAGHDGPHLCSSCNQIW